MRTVYVTSGPRGSGKSKYCEEVAKKQKGIELVSRDKLLIELFGKTSLDPYEGGHFYAQQILFERMGKLLKQKDVRVILDCWNGFPSERASIIRKLKELGADRIFCWQFHVSKETCVRWFFTKLDSAGYSKEGIGRDHALYYKSAEGIEEDGFDGVIRVDPLKPIDLSIVH